jgi:diguanylate cyclase (GGDEF)-like protein
MSAEMAQPGRTRSERLQVALLVAAGILTAVVVMGLTIVSPEALATQVVGRLAQGLGEGVGAVCCLVTAQRLTGRARTAWRLFGTGLAVWSLTDFAVGLGLLAGVDPAAPGPFDPSWLSFYGFMFAGVVLLYGRLRPERGWQGVLDGALVAVSLGIFGWRFLLGPVAENGTGGTLGTVVNLMYPFLDLACVTALAWVVARHGRHSPVWMWWVVGAFGLQLVADVAYLLSYLHGASLVGGIAAAAYAAAGWGWAAAARVRDSAGGRSWDSGGRSEPPAWSRAVPIALGLAVIGLLVDNDGWLGGAALVACALAMLRVGATLRINARLIAERDALLVTDPLTGAHNRRFLDDELERAFARSARGDDALAVVAFDLDHFKSVNDRLGHDAGDALLRTVAANVRDALRIGDVLFRPGGDEFIALLPGADAGVARAVAERIRAAVASAGDRVAPGFGVSASLGVSCFPELAPGPNDLLSTADQALYWAKNDGRDRVASYSVEEALLRATALAVLRD